MPDLPPVAGFHSVAAHSAAAGNDPEGGLTSGQGADLSNPTSELHERIDYVFVRGARVDGCWVVGDRSEDRTTSSSLWPSDHACVLADVVVAGANMP